jgi:16S rRNA (cytosine1402-N4)-methyltransferase
MNNNAMKHTSVLLQEVIAALQPKSDGRYIDATLGDGGHAKAILEHSQPNSSLLGLDQDKNQIQVAQEQLQSFGTRVTLKQARFAQIKAVAQATGFSAVDGILFDLGISSRQLDDPSYGLTFADTAPLDMRLSPDLTQTAADFLNQANEVEIGDVLYHYGDYHNSRALAHKMVRYRRKQWFRVARDVKEALQLWHPAQLAPLFQALRIWVNQEDQQLKLALPQAVSLLQPGGVLAVISFHSGEDRIVKQFFASQRSYLTVSKIIRPSFTEIKRNSRARSALLRVAQKPLDDPSIAS